MSDLTDGYLFAFHPLSKLGIPFETDAVTHLLAEVANSRTSLMNTPEEDLRMMKLNGPLGMDESEMLRRIEEFNASMCAKHIAVAKKLVAEMPHSF